MKLVLKFWAPRTQKVWKLGQERPRNPKVSLGWPRGSEWPRPQPISAQRSQSDWPQNSECYRHKKCQKRPRNDWDSSLFHFQPSQSLAGVGRPISKVKVKCAEGQNQILHDLLIPKHPWVSILVQGLPQHPSSKFSFFPVRSLTFFTNSNELNYFLHFYKCYEKLDFCDL